MTRWARLTWQAADPDGLAADLAHRLGVPVAAPPGTEPLRVIDLGGSWLEVVPWRRETPSDDPRTAGRLMLEPIPGGRPEPVPAHPAPLILAGVCWGTVELDRAIEELGPWLEPWLPPRPEPDAIDPHLGARTRIRRSNGLPGEMIVLAEPTTEGRLAASLARDGEGPCALYLWPLGGLDGWVTAARARRVTVGGRRGGPFGASVVVPDLRAGVTRPDAVAGPHVLVVADRSPSSGARAGSTIG